MSETHQDPFADRELGVATTESLRKMLRTFSLEVLKQYPKVVDILSATERLARFPSGLGVEFDANYGGLQAVTSVYGSPGTGKSQFAMACALENVMDDACVVYFDAENHCGEQRERASRWFGGEAQLLAAGSRIVRNLNWCTIDNEHNWDTMLALASQRVLHSHKRVLMILDSVQSIADEIAPGNMLGVTASLYSAMNRLARRSDGRICFLVLSEANKEGGLKGGAGSYRASMVLKIEPQPDMGKDLFEISILKNRTGRTPGSLGAFEMQWWKSRFARVEFQ